MPLGNACVAHTAPTLPANGAALIPHNADKFGQARRMRVFAAVNGFRQFGRVHRKDQAES